MAHTHRAHTLGNDSDLVNLSWNDKQAQGLHALPNEILSSHTLMRATLMSASPPQRTDSSTAPSGAVRTASHSGNAAFSPAKARDEFVSVVFWDRMVRTCARRRCASVWQEFFCAIAETRLKSRT